MKRKTLTEIAILAIAVFGLAVYLSVQDRSAYPMLDNLNFVGWLAVSAAVFALLAVPGLILCGIIALPSLIARRLFPEPTPETPPVPAASMVADINNEWSDIERRKGHWADEFAVDLDEIRRRYP